MERITNVPEVANDGVNEVKPPTQDVPHPAEPSFRVGAAGLESVCRKARSRRATVRAA